MTPRTALLAITADPTGTRLRLAGGGCSLVDGGGCSLAGGGISCSLAGGGSYSLGSSS